MMTFNIDTSLEVGEVIDQLVLCSLKETLRIFEAPNKSIPHFSYHHDKEAKKVDKIIKSLKQVIKLYGIPENNDNT